MVIRGKTDKEKLKHIYNTIRKHVKNDNCYFSEEEIQKLKEDKKNIFYKGGENNE